MSLVSLAFIIRRYVLWHKLMLRVDDGRSLVYPGPSACKADHKRSCMSLHVNVVLHIRTSVDLVIVGSTIQSAASSSHFDTVLHFETVLLKKGAVCYAAVQSEWCAC